MFRKIFIAIKKVSKFMLIFSMSVMFIMMIATLVADVMIDYRISEMWDELNTYYDAKYEAEKAELEHRYGIQSLEDPTWHEFEDHVNI